MADSVQQSLEEYRDELRLFSYRMSGSLRDAEGLVDVAFFRAGGLPLPPTGTDYMRKELYKIIARLCLDALAEQPARSLPMLSSPPCDPFQPPMPPQEVASWLEPFPDDLYSGVAYRGGSRYGERESMSLAFVAALQSLYPRQRLCLILGDVMGWRVEELAEVLGAGVVDTRNALEGARDSLSPAYHAELGTREPPRESREGELLMRYLFAWESGDVAALGERLSEDVVLQLPPSPSWYRGREAVQGYLSSYPLRGDARGRWRLLPRRCNGQLAFGVYQRDEARRVYSAHSIQVAYFTGELVSEIVAFGYPSLFPTFSLLPEVVAQG
jgi:RNA polymerase sigma-70 factor, ECF subfamily